MATRNDTSSPSRSKKNKRFGSFKGLVNKRKSKNKKNQSQSASASASASASQASSPSRPRPQSSNTNRNRDKDDSTVYSVAFDATTTASIPASDNASAKTTPLGEPVHVILLLMDPQTRRFELLQLEFDSATAKVSDITDQIVISATEPSLIIQTFETLTDLKGVELVPNKYIAEYVDSAGVIVAVPSSTKDRGKAVAAMATPILTNPKVHTMLTSSGLDIPGLPSPNGTPPQPPKDITIGNKDDAPSSTIEEPTRSSRNVLAFEASLDLQKEKDKSTPTSSPTKPSSTKSSSIVPFLLAAMAILSHLFYQIHIHYTTPLGPGDILSPGRSRGFCGLNRYSSSDCHPSTISMDDHGVLSVTNDLGNDNDNGNGNVVYQLSGKNAVCPEGTGTGTGVSACIPGMSIDAKGNIKINGSRGKVTVKRHASVTLQPWPFEEGVAVPKRSLL